jgi:hypothetical protein
MRTLPDAALVCCVWQIHQSMCLSSHEPELYSSSLVKLTNLMLWTIFIILLVLWLLGFIGHVGGALIHLLLVIAVIVLVVRLIQGRAP